jgi:DNA-binding NarL/FixJ family response regulator
MSSPVRVLIVDDDPLVRSGLRTMLRGNPAIQVVGEATDGDEILAALDHHRSDVVQLDIRMPRLDGLQALALVRSQPHPPTVVMLTTFDTDELVLQAIRAGAAGFLVKDTPPEEIVRAIKLVAVGDGMLSPGVTKRLLERLAGDGTVEQQRADAVNRLAQLSPRGRLIAEAIAQGKSNAAIGDDLHLSVSTVKNHVSTILSTLSLDNRVQIALLVQDADRQL